MNLGIEQMCIKIDIVLSYDDDINFDYSKTRKLFYFHSAPQKHPALGIQKQLQKNIICIG